MRNRRRRLDYITLTMKYQDWLLPTLVLARGLTCECKSECNYLRWNAKGKNHSETYGND